MNKKGSVKVAMIAVTIVTWCASGAIAGPIPALDGNLMLWLKADAITGVPSGGVIDTWADQSGNSNDLGATGTARPTYQPGVYNGKPVVRFDGNDTMTRSSLAGMTSDHTTFLLMRHTAFNVNYPVPYAYEGNLYVHAPYSGAGFTQSFYNVRGTPRPNWGGTLDVFSTLAWTENGTQATLHTDGVLRTPIYTGGSPPSLGGRVFGIGARPGGGAGEYVTGEYAEVLIYNVPLTDPQRQQVETYLAQRWIPEPSTFCLTALGLIGLMAYGRRRRR